MRCRSRAREGSLATAGQQGREWGGEAAGKKNESAAIGRGRSGNSRDVRVNQGSNQVLTHFDNLTLP